MGGIYYACGSGSLADYNILYNIYEMIFMEFLDSMALFIVQKLQIMQCICGDLPSQAVAS